MSPIRPRRGVTRLREARLRLEAAARYPGVPAGEWLAAGSVATRFVDRQGVGRVFAEIARRTLPDDAFDFRGGSPEMLLRQRARTRWADHPGPPGDRAR